MLLDHLEELLLHPAAASDAAIIQRIATIRDELEWANARVYESIRSAVRSGDDANVLRSWLPSHSRDSSQRLEHEGYDYLDEIVAGVLQLDEPGVTSVEPTAEMVFYQPTPARHILDLFDRAALTRDDVFVDLGAGLGHVIMLAAICTPARCIGIEVEPAYIACAKRAASRLALDRATFIEGDARDTPLDHATIFYLYTPFSGTMLRNMLDLVRAQANTREIRVATYGPCTLTIAEESWLVTADTPSVDRVTIFRSSI